MSFFHRTEATRNPPLSSPPTFAGTSTNPIIGDNSRSQMKRKESESLFTSKKRVRCFPDAHSDQDDAIELDLDEHAKYKRDTGIYSKPAPEEKTKGGLSGWQPGASLSVSSTSGKRPPPFPNNNKRLSESAVESIRPATPDPPSKLAGLPFDAYKRAESRIVPASDPSPSIVSASPVGEYPFGKNPFKVPLKRRRLPSAPQTTRYLSKTKAISSDAEVIEISDDDDSPPSLISLTKSKTKSIKPSFEASSSATKEFLPKAPVEVIEVLDSDDEQLPSKAQLREKNVGRASSGRLSELLQESATGSNPRRDQSRHISSLGGDSFEGIDRYADVMDIDGGDPLDISSSPRALSQELQATDDANDNQGTQGSIPLPSSGPSSVGLSPKDNYLSTPPAASPSIGTSTGSSSNRLGLSSVAVPSSLQAPPPANKHRRRFAMKKALRSISYKDESPLQQSFILPTRPNSSKKPITASPSIGTSTGSSSNRTGFSSVAVPSSLQAPPPANKHRRQFAKKMASRSISYKDEDVGESSIEPKGTANTKANKGKEKEIRESSSSPSGTESINMHGLQEALAMDSDTLKQRPVSPTSSKKQGQTLAEAIISAGQLNSTKKTRRRLQNNTKDVPVDHTSDVEAGIKDRPTSVSPPIPEVPTRRSSRLSSNRSSRHSSDRPSRFSSSRSSRSPSSGGLGTAFDFDFGPPTVSRTFTHEVQDLSALPSLAKTYGGFRALTWKDFCKDLNNFTPKTYYAKDIPHDLQDDINSMSEFTQMMGGMRDLFKATILENTVEDEPDAPPIEIWNSVDTQSTPPWEFYYTNNMWLGEGVPPPDIKTLLSCTCKGGCNPKSKTCACLLRQKEATGDPLLEFAYDKDGSLKIPGYPIFECNDLCGCSDECQNRVVQQGRKVSVNIGKTETKGWGVFAGSNKIPKGTYIGIYSGELLTDAEAQERGIKYNKSGRTYLFDIDFHHLKEGNSLWENCYTVDAYHAGNFTRFLNHSCDPNCRLYACYINEGNIQKPLLAIFTRRDIEPFEEICFNYQGVYDDDDNDDDEGDDNKILDPDHGKDMIYVRCRCGAKNCTGTMFK